jgi:hypothetical protein
MAKLGWLADIAERANYVERLQMTLGKQWISLTLLTALCGASTWARAGEAVDHARNETQCSPAPHWWAQNLEDHQIFHLIRVGANKDLRWDGSRVSFASLRSNLSRIAKGEFARIHQVGVSLGRGGDCETLQRVRVMMETSLDCKAAMCRDGDLDIPPPPSRR